MTRKQLWKQFKFYAGAWLGGVFFRGLFFFARNEMQNEEHFNKPLEEGRSVVLALWHGQMLPIINSFRNRGVYAMVGYHRDAEMIARVLNRIGYHLIRGSSRDRGREAMQQSLEAAREPGNVIALTCDGPIGPYREVKPGVGVISQKTDAVVVPVAANCSRKKVLTSSWDKFYLPLPFSRNTTIVGEPIYPEEYQNGDPIKMMLQDIEYRLNQLQDQADALYPEDV